MLLRQLPGQHHFERDRQGRSGQLIWERYVKYQALYRKYRPRVFDDVKGQDIIVRTLRNQVKNGRIAHAYLFCGSRGTGKTTCAKILAQAACCLHPVDGNPCCECESCRSIQEGSSMNVIEMDAASRNGVDDFRRIIDEIAYPPGEGKKKVYIIDEVHMLTPAAFNAFLKTLEEPPEYAVFILATTDPQRLLPTVLSRCQRFDFRRIPADIISDRLRAVFEAEDISADDEAVRSIARRAEGGMRDALSIADRCVSFFPGETLTKERVLEVLGTADTAVWRSMLHSAVNGDASAMIRQFDDMLMDGRDVRQIISDFTWYLRDLLIFKASGGSSETDSLVEEDRVILLEDASGVDELQIMYYIEVLSELSWSLRSTMNTRVLAEIALINLCRPQTRKELRGSVEARLTRIETQLEDGVIRALPAHDGTLIREEPSHRERSPREAAASDEADIREREGQPAGSAGIREPGMAVAPELFRKIAAQWKQTMSSLPNRGRGEVLAACSEISCSGDEPDTILIALEDNWYRPFSSDKALLQNISDAIAGKYGVRPKIRFINASSESGEGRIRVDSKVEALQKEGILFPIEVE